MSHKEFISRGRVISRHRLKVEIGTELASALSAPLQQNNTHATGVRMLMQLHFLGQERPVPTSKSLSATNHHLWWEQKMMI